MYCTYFLYMLVVTVMDPVPKIWIHLDLDPTRSGSNQIRIHLDLDPSKSGSIQIRIHLDLDLSRSGSDYWLLQKLSSKSLESCFLFQNEAEIISASFREKISYFDESIGRIRVQKAKSWEPDSDTNFVNSNPQHKYKNLFVENFNFLSLCNA